MHALLEPSETALDLLRRSRSQASMATGLPFLVHLRPTDVVQISGPSASGKSELLLHLAARCLLPRSLGGQGGDVLFFDLAHQLDALRLAHLLRRAVERGRSSSSDGGGGPSAAATGDVVTACMSRLAVYHCDSSLQFYAALAALRSSSISSDGCRAPPSASAPALDRLLGAERVRRAEAAVDDDDSPTHLAKRRRVGDGDGGGGSGDGSVSSSSGGGVTLAPSPVRAAAHTPAALSPALIDLSAGAAGSAPWGSDGRVRLLLVDHMGTFYWQDTLRKKQRGLTSTSERVRADGSVAGTEARAANNALALRLQRLQSAAAASLKRAMRNCGLATVLACPSLFGKRRRGEQSSLADAWQRLVTREIALSAARSGAAIPCSSRGCGDATSFTAAMYSKHAATKRFDFVVDDGGVRTGSER